ncbi:MAG: heme-binding domain-containing protein [Ginsengibacter sp.]
MSRIKKIFLLIVVVIIAIQFIQPARNKSGQVLPTDISKTYNVPENVQAILKRSCYDCHSNNTVYPWYSCIQPIGWWLASHIKRGKEELNFSEFGSYSSRKQRSKFFAISKSVEDGTMPFASYTLIHTNSKLFKEDKAIIINWASKTKNSLSINN